VDLSPVLVQGLATWWWIALVALFIGLVRLPVVKGYFGELLVRLTARLSLDRETYRQVHNVTLRTRDGTTQVDHVIVSPFGVFVIETKNMGGWIFGGEKEPQWTQKIFRKTFRFQNPPAAELQAREGGGRNPRGSVRHHPLRGGLHGRQPVQDTDAAERDEGSRIHSSHQVVPRARVLGGAGSGTGFRPGIGPHAAIAGDTPEPCEQPEDARGSHRRALVSGLR